MNMGESNGALVEIFRALKNPQKFGLVIGKVTADLPDIKIDIGSGIVLEKDDLMFTASILKDYEREYEITSDDMTATGTKLDSSGVDYSFTAAPAVINDTTTGNPRPIPTIPEGAAASWDTSATSFEMESNDFKSTGKIKLTDELKTGDTVAIIASESNQMFLVIDKVLSF